MEVSILLVFVHISSLCTWLGFLIDFKIHKGVHLNVNVCVYVGAYMQI